MQRIFLNVGYELSEKQLRAYFVKFGVLSDLYLPKHANGRNKGYGFATFASAESLSLVLQQPQHVVNGVVVQVKRAGPRPVDNPQVSKPPPAVKSEHVPFGQGPRIYVGGVHECLSEVRLRDHFAKWGSISDIYFPGPRGQKRSNYCFVTFEDQQSAEWACRESDRTLDGWPLDSISMADDRKQSERDTAIVDLTVMPLLSPAMSAADPASKASYALWLQLQYQQQLAALETTFSAAAAHELSQSSPHFKKEPLQNLHAFPYGLSPGMAGSTLPGMPAYPYRQPASANRPAQDPSAGHVQPQQPTPRSHLSSSATHAMHAFFPMGSKTIHNMGYPEEELDQIAVSAQQALLYTAEESLQHQAAARLGANVAELGQAGAEPRPRGPFPEGMQQRFGKLAGGVPGNPAHYGGMEMHTNPFVDGRHVFSGGNQGYIPQNFSAQNFSAQNYPAPF